MLQVNKRYIHPLSHNRPAYPMTPAGLLYHTTNNWSDTAGADMHAKYMSTTPRVVSWHDTVDSLKWIQHIPHNENAWHAGDGGKGFYNRNFIGLEICCNRVDQGQPLDRDTYENAVDVAAQIIIEHDLTILEPHHRVKGKNCSHDTLFNRKQFERDVWQRVADYKTPQMNWKEKIMKAGRDAGLMNDIHKPDEPASKWFVTQLILNSMKDGEKK
jgi:N-acetylmuramoyl-L-alanine amidase